MNDPHPDLAAIEAFRTGEASVEEAAHVDRCPECRRALEDLRGLAGRLSEFGSLKLEPGVPSSVKEAIRKRLRRPSWREWVPVAAAAVLMVGLAGLWLLPPADPPLPGDVDRSGRVDVVDAYVLAMALRDGKRPDHDVNGDGVVDDRDVDEIARLSVSLEIHP